jgi:hypothetical protein
MCICDVLTTRGLCPRRNKNQSNPSCVVVARGNLQRAAALKSADVPVRAPTTTTEATCLSVWAHAVWPSERVLVHRHTVRAKMYVRRVWWRARRSACPPRSGGKAACAARVRNHGAVTAVGHTAAAGASCTWFHRTLPTAGRTSGRGTGVQGGKWEPVRCWIGTTCQPWCLRTSVTAVLKRI